MSTEKDVLIQNTEKQQTSEVTEVGLRHGFIIPMLILFYLPAEIMVYIINEWTQQKVIHEQFPNASGHHKLSPCEDKNKSDGTATEYKHAERVTSEWILYNKLAEIIPLLFINMILPSYSDTYGRKFVFIIAMTGDFLKNVLVTVTLYFNLQFQIITVAYGVEGLTGGSTAITSMAFSYIADLTLNNGNRVLGIVAMEAVFLIAGLCPGFISGYMIQSGLGFETSAIICTSTMSTALIIVICFLPETLPMKRRVSRKPVWTMLKRTFDFYTSKEFKGQRVFYILLLLAYGVSCIAGNNRGTIETLYFLDQPFCWDPVQFGYYTLVRQISKAIFGTITIRPLQKCFSNEVILIISSVSLLASYIVEGLAITVMMVYASSVIGSLSFLNTPLIKGLMSSMTPRDKQGSLFASLSVVSETSSLISYFSTNLVYNATVSVMNGFVFLLMATFGGIQLIILIVVYCKSPKVHGHDDKSLNLP